MNPTQLDELLEKKYTIKGIVDLADLSISPQAAYQFFNLLYQKEFAINDRVVVYTTHAIPDSFLSHLYQATSLIDISNFFVLVCSPHNIDQQLKSVAMLHSYDLTAFQSLQIELDSTKEIQKNFVVPDTLCPLPWSHMEISNQGKVHACCVYCEDVGDIKKSSLNNIFHGQDMNILRQQLINGNKPAGCNRCWDLESKGLVSNRNYHMSLLKKDLLTAYIDKPNIKSLDIKPGNTCNFKCRICNPGSSSLFAQEYASSNQLTVQSFNWTEHTNAFTEINNLLPSLTNIDMYGGEPFLIKQLSTLVEQAVAHGYADNIRLHYNSNGSIYPAGLVDQWKHFKHVDIQFSIDNTGAMFELERGGSWQSVDSNIKRLLNAGLTNVNVGIMPAISIMNIFYIDQLLEWANQLGLPINPLYVTKPDGFDLKHLTANARKLIFDKFQSHSHPIIQGILNYIKSTPESDGEEFKKICRHFDLLRSQNFSDSHPEIAHAMGYIK